jgi:hypothetical protein
VVEQRAAGEEAVLVARHLVAAAVDHEGGAFFHAEADVAFDAFQRLRVTIGPISASSSMPFLTFSAARAFGQQRHDLVGHVAHQHGHADGHAALAGRAVGAPISASTAWSRSASGITTMWFLAPPRACTRLPWCAPVS